MNWIKHKRRLDRGGVYMGYYQMIGTSLILIKIFNLDNWYYFPAFILLVFISRYTLGFLDDIFILSKEQDQYAGKNPFMKNIDNKLNKLLKHAEKNHKND